jgi:hypothetical protein
MAASHLQDNTKAAGVIAALGDFQVNAMRWGEAKARRIPIGNVCRSPGDEVLTARAVPGYNALHNCAQFPHLIEPDEGVDFRQRGLQLSGEPL